MQVLIILAILSLSLVFAADSVDILTPATWYNSVAALMAIISAITPYVTKVLTALLKDRFTTTGNTTKLVAAAIALILGGVGGYFGLGFMAGTTGLSAALFGAVNTLVGYIGSQAIYASEQQRETSLAKKIVEEESK